MDIAVRVRGGPPDFIMVIRMTLEQSNDLLTNHLKFDEFVKDFKCIHENSCGYVKSFTTDFYMRADYDDGSFIIEQPVSPNTNKTLRFGPLSVTVSELYSRGFWLCVESFAQRRKHKLILRNTQNPREAYRLTMIFDIDLGKHSDLSMFIKDQSEPVKETIGYTNLAVVRDPFDELQAKYPAKPKHIKSIGNLTFEEYVKQQLRENRRLNYV